MIRGLLSRRAAAFVGLLLVILAAGYAVDQYEPQPRFLRVDQGQFVALFAKPPAADSVSTRRELDELLAIQERRIEGAVRTARADRKTEVWQFAAALGLPRERMRDMDALNELFEQVEDDVRPYVRAAKYRFLRLRPYEIEARIKPCIDDVRGDLSYPSGHATYGYVIALLLAELVPERRTQLMARAREFAQQRAVCGVHFPSDLEAGRLGAEWLVRLLLASPEYRAASEAARQELRAVVR
jgi:acid phosphatase (class A)